MSQKIKVCKNKIPVLTARYSCSKFALKLSEYASESCDTEDSQKFFTC